MKEIKRKLRAAKARLEGKSRAHGSRAGSKELNNAGVVIIRFVCKKETLNVLSSPILPSPSSSFLSSVFLAFLVEWNDKAKEREPATRGRGVAWRRQEWELERERAQEQERSKPLELFRPAFFDDAANSSLTVPLHGRWRGAQSINNSPLPVTHFDFVTRVDPPPPRYLFGVPHLVCNFLHLDFHSASSSILGCRIYTGRSRSPKKIYTFLILIINRSAR